MSDPTKSVNNIHGMKEGEGYRAGMALPQKRKKGDETESLISTKVPRTKSQALDLEKMQRNHGNGMASYRDTAFSIDKILSPSSKDADLASAMPTRAAEITKNSGRSFLDDKKMTKKSEAKQIAEHAEVENVANYMPVDKWYNTLLWQQHQQQYQPNLAAASAFYHTQHFQHPLPNAAPPQQTQPPWGPARVPLPVGPPNGIPPAFCPVMPGRVHPFNCQCAEQMSEQPYFLLTPAGYSIPSPFQPDHQYSSLRYCRRRKARTVFTEYQIRGLEARFVHQQYLSTHERVELANVLFLTEGQVKTWFQNRRMKQKKLSRDSEHHFDDDDDDTNDELDFDDEADFNNDLDDEGSTKTLHIKN